MFQIEDFQEALHQVKSVDVIVVFLNVNQTFA